MMYETEKAAQAAGLKTAEEWQRARPPRTPQRWARSTRVHGKRYFQEDQCEELVTEDTALRRRLDVKLEAKPVAHRGSSPLYRISDFEPTVLYTQSRVVSRGWTKTLIQRFLGEPDETRSNPHYRCAAPMKLYSSRRIKAAERSEEFQQAIAQTKTRRKRAEQVVERRRQETENAAEQIRFSVPRMEMDELVRRACQHYNSRQADRWDGGLFATPGFDRDFLDRICVNFLRHEMTPYDAHLQEFRGRVGVNEAYEEIKLRVLTRIGNVYPELEAECLRQICRMYIPAW